MSEARKALDKLELEMSSAVEKYGEELKLDVTALAEPWSRIGLIEDALVGIGVSYVISWVVALLLVIGGFVTA